MQAVAHSLSRAAASPGPGASTLHRSSAARPHRVLAPARCAALDASFPFPAGVVVSGAASGPPGETDEQPRLQLATQRLQLDAALALLDQLPSGQLDAGTGSELVLAFCEQSPARVSEAERVLVHLGSAPPLRRQPLMRALTAPVCCAAAGQRLSPAAGRALVRALLATHRLERAVAVFRELQAAGVQQPTATYTDLIACVPARHASRAGEVR